MQGMDQLETLAEKIDQEEGFVNEENLVSYAGPDTPITKVVTEMVSKLKDKCKVVTDSYSTPQILVLSQDTLVVNEIFKALRDQFQISEAGPKDKKAKKMKKVKKGEQ